ncbi:alanine racemase [bacterium BMS3Abin02]|nr:alanine racemase [bacterium BMS3Abin02]HDL48648.1 alanine racemase [Actinomycetota bacterium]
MVRPSWAEVDLGAVADNVRTLRELVAPASVCAVVKADGYGHGDVPVAEAAIGAGADVLAVALVEEGIRLREAGIEAPVLLLSEPPVQGAAEAIRWNLTPTVYRAEFAAALSEVAPRTIPVHVKVDTGMHRVGAAIDDAPDLIRRVVADPHLQLDGVWTHFAVADEDDPFTEVQLERFAGVLADLDTLEIDVPVRHAANTAGAIRFPQARFDMVRVGIGMYGINPAPDLITDVSLRPAMRIVSEVAMVRRYPAGVRPSYGRRRPLSEEATVVTIPIGYADGLPRSLASDGEVLIAGRRHRLAGNVTMDQILVDVDDTPVKVGDEVVLIGSQNGDEITATEWAGHLGTIAYEIVCQIGPRLPRRYL